MTGEPNTTAWMPQLEVTNTACKDYLHLYAGCGCIHQETQSLTVHWKECVYATRSKMPEEKYQAMRKDHPCKEIEQIHVLFKGRCQLCKTGPQVLARSRDSFRRAGYIVRAALNVEDRTPPRQKPATDQKPEPLSDEEINRRVGIWESAIKRHEQLLLRRIEDRRQQRRDAYNAFISAERAFEVESKVPPEDRFYLYNFTGGEGGDLLTPIDVHQLTPSCTYCGNVAKPLNGPPEKLPCGCHVHRDCAADLFLIIEHGLSRQKARCTCGTRFNLRRLHLNFEDST
ncbi:hypothetical protein BKA61DRAFT_674470 [Leptodontidium sp. MPI-SDFR-AT-0119]|nr:hypothetical protein BKA61DRAFT_674470 [Leptodontidium sp. MPI-SDFR-AT-0119]